MKKILLLFILLFMTAQAGLCANTSPEKKSAARRIMESNSNLHQVNVRISDNFRFDHQFANYIKYRGVFFESDRQRLIGSVFTTSSGANSNSEAIASLITKFNNEEIVRYKAIVQEYCKYNAFKFVKRDPQACSQQRIESLF